jgi:DNA sulfur modification protein DndE
MKAIVDHVRVSQRSRDILMTMKRRTGIEHWNVLCRWALFDSLANPNKPVSQSASPESNIDMTWEVFGGESAGVIVALLVQRAKTDGVKLVKPELAAYFRSHLERGISQLQNYNNLSSLCARIL